MVRPNIVFTHSILTRLDATIEKYEDSIKTLTNTLPDAKMRKSKGILIQLHQEIMNIREEAVTTLTQLNTFGATLETMAHPEAGVDVVLEDVLKWFMLLTECERTFISLYDSKNEEFVLSISDGWLDADLRPMEHTISEIALQEVRKTKDIFLSSNVEMASESYHKSGSWRMPLRMLMSIPLIWNNQLIGIFYGDRKITSGALSRDMMPLLKLYAAQATIAIHNAQLFATLTNSPPKNKKGQE